MSFYVNSLELLNVMIWWWKTCKLQQLWITWKTIVWIPTKRTFNDSINYPFNYIWLSNHLIMNISFFLSLFFSSTTFFLQLILLFFSRLAILAEAHENVSSTEWEIMFEKWLCGKTTANDFAERSFVDFHHRHD